MRPIARMASYAHMGFSVALDASELDPEMRRAAAAYLTVTLCAVPAAVLAEGIGCTRQNISKLVKAMEDRRDDPAVNRVLSDLERRARQ